MLIFLQSFLMALVSTVSCTDLPYLEARIVKKLDLLITVHLVLSHLQGARPRGYPLEDQHPSKARSITAGLWGTGRSWEKTRWKFL